MAEVEDSQSQQPTPAPSQPDNLSQKLDKLNISSTFSIWPPSQRTRDAVINRLILTLSEPSVLSKRYGSMLPEEASPIARAIEEEAFAAAAAAASAAVGSGESGADIVSSPSIDEGIEVLQIYSKEISKRMLDAVKSRVATPASDVSSVQSSAPAADPAETPASEEDSSVKNESSS